MIQEFDNAYEMLKFAAKIIGLETNVVINSNVYLDSEPEDYGDEDEDECTTSLNIKNGLDLDNDIITIFGTIDKPININDIVSAFDKIKKQFKILEEKNLDNRTFYYEGIIFNAKTNQYDISWGS